MKKYALVLAVAALLSFSVPVYADLGTGEQGGKTGIVGGDAISLIWSQVVAIVGVVL